jgi:hypothetical protein
VRSAGRGRSVGRAPCAARNAASSRGGGGARSERGGCGCGRVRATGGRACCCGCVGPTHCCAAGRRVRRERQRQRRGGAELSLQRGAGPPGPADSIGRPLTAAALPTCGGGPGPGRGSRRLLTVGSRSRGSLELERTASCGHRRKGGTGVDRSRRAAARP